MPGAGHDEGAGNGREEEVDQNAPEEPVVGLVGQDPGEHQGGHRHQSQQGHELPEVHPEELHRQVQTTAHAARLDGDGDSLEVHAGSCPRPARAR